MGDETAEIKEAEAVGRIEEAESEIQKVEEELEAAEQEPSLEEQVAELQAQAAEYLDGWQRARAELANFKRRTEAQRAEMVLSANADLLTRLLPVLDDLRLALDSSPQEDAGTWKEWGDGVALVAHKFAGVLQEVGVVPIETDGQSFDPMIHEAISYEENPDFESGQIIAQVRQGYLLGNRVLRPAMVRVAQ